MNENENSREWSKFAILAIILIGTPFVIALLRPIIFGKIVPAVMYREEQIGVVLPTQPMSTPIPIITPELLSTEISVEQQPTIATEGDQTQLTPVFTQPDPTAVPSTDTNANTDNGLVAQEHIVKSGQTLYQIAVIYGVSVEDILRINQIEDANKIQAGFKIKIPVKGK